METTTFLLNICRQAGEPLDVRDPLGVADALLVETGDTAEGRLLRRLIAAIAFDWGNFTEGELWLLSRERMQLVSALMYAKMAGQYSALEWAAMR
jgi:hypothetical protein